MSDDQLAEKALAELAAWVDEGSALLAELWDRLPACRTSGLVGLLAALTGREAGLQGALQMLAREVERVLGERHGRGPIEDDYGVTIAAVDRGGASTKWDVEGAWPHLLARARDEQSVDKATGEVLEDGFATAFRVVKECCGIGYLRVEALRRRGLDPDEYRSRSGWRWQVKLP